MRDLSLSSPIQLVESRKRFRKEIGKLGRNIRQRLFCGFFSKGNDGEDQVVIDENGETKQGQVLVIGDRMDESSAENNFGQQEVGHQQLPQQP